MMEITRNVILLILEGGISVNSGKEDEDMTEETMDQLCIEEISKVYKARSGWRLFESDFSSVAI